MLHAQGVASEQNQRKTINDTTLMLLEQKELQDLYSEEEKAVAPAAITLEPDATFFTGQGRPIETDFFVVSPAAPTYLKGSAKMVGHALKVRKRIKEGKYKAAALAVKHDFHPCLAVHGRPNKGFFDLLRRFAAATSQEVGMSPVEMMTDIQFALARGNALCARKTIAQAWKVLCRKRKAAALQGASG